MKVNVVQLDRPRYMLTSIEQGEVFSKLSYPYAYYMKCVFNYPPYFNNIPCVNLKSGEIIYINSGEIVYKLKSELNIEDK